MRWIGQDQQAYRIVLLNAYTVPSKPYQDLLATHDELRSQSVDGLRAFLGKVRKFMGTSKAAFETVSYHGTLESVMPHVAEEKSVDCVVLHCGHCAAERLYNGKIPVLFLPDQFPD